MPISINCPKCQQRYQVQDQFAGRRVSCKRCSAQFQVPGPAAVQSSAKKIAAPEPVPQQAARQCPLCAEHVSDQQSVCPTCGCSIDGVTVGTVASPQIQLPTLRKKNRWTRERKSALLRATMKVTIAAIVLGILGFGGWQGVKFVRQLDFKELVQHLPEGILEKAPEPTKPTEPGVEQWLEKLRQDPEVAAKEPETWKKAAAEVPLDINSLSSLMQAVGEPGVPAEFAALVLERYNSSQLRDAQEVLVGQLSNPSVSILMMSLKLISKIGPEGRTAIPPVAEFLAKHTYQPLRIATRECLVSLAGESPGKVIGELIDQTTQPVARGNLIRALAAVDPRAGIERVTVILEKDSDVTSRHSAIQALAECQKEGIPLLKQLIFSKNANDRTTALEACTRLGADAEPLLPELREILLKPRFINTAFSDRRLAESALINMGQPANPMFRQALLNGSRELKSTALRFFAQHPDLDSVKMIIGLLGDEAWQGSAINALGRTVEKVPTDHLPEIAVAISQCIKPVSGDESVSGDEFPPPPPASFEAIYVFGAIAKRVPEVTVPREIAPLVLRSRQGYLAAVSAKIPDLSELKSTDSAPGEALRLQQHFEALKWSLHALAKSGGAGQSESQAAAKELLPLAQKLRTHPFAKPVIVQLAVRRSSTSIYSPDPPRELGETTNTISINTRGKNTIVTLGMAAVSEAVIQQSAREVKLYLSQVDELLRIAQGDSGL